MALLPVNGLTNSVYFLEMTIAIFHTAKCARHTKMSLYTHFLEKCVYRDIWCAWHTFQFRVQNFRRLTIMCVLSKCSSLMGYCLAFPHFL